MEPSRIEPNENLFKLEFSLYIDTLIAAGKNVDLKKYQSSHPNFSPLLGEAAEEAFNNLSESYKIYKQGIQENLASSYVKYLKNVEICLPKFNRPDTPSDEKHAVANKLKELALARKEKEKEFSVLHRIFHIIGQVFKGHGIQTEGDWGMELAAKIKGDDFKTLKNKIKYCIDYKISSSDGRDPEDILESIKKQINDLSDSDFEKILNDVIFKVPTNLTFSQKYKLTFFENLNEGKRIRLNDQLVSRDDWYDQAFDFIYGAHDKKGEVDKEKIKHFLSQKAVSKFQCHPEEIIKLYNKQGYKNDFSKTFFYAFVGSVIRSYIPEANTPEIARFKASPMELLGFLIHLKNTPDIKADLLKPGVILTEEEIKRMIDNVDLNRIF